jgi:hypothetical protein
MALIIEDGSGVPNAESYQTVAQCEAFAIKFFGASLTGSATNKEAALRRASKFMDSLPWKGTRTNGRDQGLAWPRAGVTDAEGNEIADDEIPQEVKDALHIFARAEFIEPNSLSPIVVRNEGIKRERVGPLETEYADPSKRIEAFRPIVTQALDMVEGLLAPKRVGYTLERA